MTLTADFERRRLRLDRPFTIARGTTTAVEIALVRIEDGDGVVGLGGAGPSRYYGETADTVEAVLPELLAVVEDVGDPHLIARIERRLRETVGRNPAARAAVSVAVHDLVAKHLEVPLYRYWGLDPAETVATAYTIGIDGVETVREKTREALERGYETLKIKVGTDRDEALLEAIRDVAPDARLFVDANEAWSPSEAIRKIDRLAAYDLAFVEQPVSADDPAGLKRVFERSRLPIAVDESCSTATDVPRVADRCDIVNLKLMKCGGLREAFRVVHAARAHGLEVLGGCMVESNASIAAACHLAPLLDYADLDGSLLLAEDPYEGVPMPDGEIDLAALDRFGTGAIPK